MANITNPKQGQIFFCKEQQFCSDIHFGTHLELKCLKVSVPTLIWVVMAQRCNNCIAGDHTLPSSQLILVGNGNYSLQFHSQNLKVSLGPLK